MTVVARPSTLVNPFMGTGVGGTAVGDIDGSPAADVPFGMMQWGPDTSPHRASGGGYFFGDTATSGFSLTHLNGPGCPGLGDISILPTVGTVGRGDAPESATDRFTHAAEHASPGRYAVALASPRVSVDIGVTTRTGIATFTFPRVAAANVLFKVADSAVASSDARARVIGSREVAGSVTSGDFCDVPGNYTLSFDAQFSRPFDRSGSWRAGAVAAGSRSASGARSGVYVSFDARTEGSVTMKVGISFVSVANARANLAAENHGWSTDAVARAASAQWDAMLGGIGIAGGTATERATFYSALYRSLLHPNVFSDDNGDYMGFDGRRHVAAGYTQYANFSSWDTYRSEVPLQAMLAPAQSSAMMRSLLADADQSGWLPKWAYTDVNADEMNGDSDDPILAEAYAFGARNFDAGRAVRDMVHGATAVGTGTGWDVERQDLDEYLTRGWVQSDRRDRTSLDYTIGGSETLEYAIDDNAIALLARSVGDDSVASTFRTRAEYWRHLFNPATGYLAARDASGAFPPGPAFQPSNQADIGQDGWEEGNSVQYTWNVPQDLRGLFDEMGGNAAAITKLDTFFTALNTSRHEPYDWAGNEPALGIPWAYDYAGAPWRTQDVVRRIATTLYAPTPNGEPGNDDLGALASWYVWAAIGLYPETPGSANLVLSSPMFSHVVIALGSGRTLTIDAPGASSANRYVQALQVQGTEAPAACGVAARAYQCPWLAASVTRTGAHLTYTLGPAPNRHWAAAPAAAPPSITSTGSSSSG